MPSLASASRAALLAALAAIGCTRSHDLGVDVTTSTSGGGAATTSSQSTGTGGAPAASGTGGAVEPGGPTALTIVNGIADYAAARFCFLPGDTPWPAAAGGLPFAAGQAVDLAAALPTGTDVTPWVIAGDLAAAAGMTCTEMLALAQPTDGGAPPPLVAASLGVIPQTVLASDRSLLLATTGCLGGAGHDAPGATGGCGMGYSSQTPTPGVVLLAMSRITDATHVSLQVVNASAVLSTTDVRLRPNVLSPTELNVAPSLVPGAIAPEPPFAALTLAQYGALGGVQIKTYSPGSSSATSTTALGDVLGESSVGTAGFVNGAELVLVAVGGGATVPVGAFWRALTFALVKAAP